MAKKKKPADQPATFPSRKRPDGSGRPNRGRDRQMSIMTNEGDVANLAVIQQHYNLGSASDAARLAWKREAERCTAEQHRQLQGGA